MKDEEMKNTMNEEANVGTSEKAAEEDILSIGDEDMVEEETSREGDDEEIAAAEKAAAEIFSADEEEDEEEEVPQDEDFSEDEDSSENDVQPDEEESYTETDKAENVQRRRRIVSASRSRGRRSTLEALDYMGTMYKAKSPVERKASEFAEIARMIEHNQRVRRRNRSDFKYLDVIILSTDVKRENDDPRKTISSRLYGRQCIRGNDGKIAFGLVPLMFEGEDFTAYSGIVQAEGESDYSYHERQHRYINHVLDAIVRCVPISIVKDHNNNPVYVVCSRSFAMEQVQDQAFFRGEEPFVKVDSDVPAYVLSADDNGVRVECCGIETRINKGLLTASRYVDVASNYYNTGDKLYVTVTELELDRENKTVEKFVVSGVRYEVKAGQVRDVRTIDLKSKPKFSAKVMLVLPDFYMVLIPSEGITGTISKQNVYNCDKELTVNSTVSMEVYSIDEKRNRVRGGCYLMQMA